MILGILAAIAAPKFLNTSAIATDNGLKQTLAIIRDAIELHTAANGGQLPGADGAEATFIAEIEVYVRGTFPKCPVGAKNNQVKVTTAAGVITGEANPLKSWHYSNQTGEFIINSNAATNSDGAVNYDDF